MTESIKQDFIKNAEEIGISIDERMLSSFDTYYKNLIEWNAVMNLTAITEEKDVYEKHFLDSLTITKIVSRETLDKGCTLIDMGTGAGFPGIPLRIFYPEMRLTLVDSVGKKADFCQLAADTLHLKGVKVLKDRSEELGANKDYREKFDAATARAVAGLPVLCEYLLPLVKVGGIMLAQKGESAPEEVNAAGNAIRKLGGADAELTEVVLPEVEGKRYLVKIPKVRPTPAGYPRRTGLPLKKPIL